MLLTTPFAALEAPRVHAPITRLAACVILLAAQLVAASAAADPQLGCNRGITEWLERCSRSKALAITGVQCPAGAVIVALDVPGRQPLRVEIVQAKTRGFRKVGELGLTPVGEFPNWGKEPEALRRAFDELAECVRGDPGLPLPTGRFEARGEGRAPGPAVPQPRLPWLLALAVLAAALGIRPSRNVPRAWLVGLLFLAVASFAFRRLTQPLAFFHQNGQGAWWISMALDALQLSPYGPGFSEIFGLAARWFDGEPEHGVFLVQSILGAAIPPCAAIIACSCGASRSVAIALGAVLGFEPLLGRLAHSESYFAAGVTFGFLAAAWLAAATVHGSLRSLRFWASVVGVGLLVSQAARMHPVTWVPLALLPMLPLLQAGPGAERIKLASASAAGIALVVLVATGPTLLGVLHGSLGQQWMPAAGSGGQRRFHVFVLGAVALGVLIVARKKERTPAVLLGAGMLALLAARSTATALVGPPHPFVDPADERQFLPIAVALAASATVWLGRIAPWSSRWLVLGALVAGGVYALARQSLALLPTDAEEARKFQSWRGELPVGSTVAYLGGARKHMLMLPLYAGVTDAQPMPLRAHEPLPELFSGERSFYYRSSLCEMPEAGSFCKRIEERYVLEPRFEAILPARPSMITATYTGSLVRVGVYRIVTRKSSP